MHPADVSLFFAHARGMDRTTQLQMNPATSDHIMSVALSSSTTGRYCGPELKAMFTFMPMPEYPYKLRFVQHMDKRAAPRLLPKSDVPALPRESFLATNGRRRLNQKPPSSLHKRGCGAQCANTPRAIEPLFRCRAPFGSDLEVDRDARCARRPAR